MLLNRHSSGNFSQPLEYHVMLSSHPFACATESVGTPHRTAREVHFCSILSVESAEAAEPAAAPVHDHHMDPVDSEDDEDDEMERDGGGDDGEVTEENILLTMEFTGLPRVQVRCFGPPPATSFCVPLLLGQADNFHARVSRMGAVIRESRQICFQQSSKSTHAAIAGDRAASGARQ